MGSALTGFSPEWPFFGKSSTSVAGLKEDRPPLSAGESAERREKGRKPMQVPQSKQYCNVVADLPLHPAGGPWAAEASLSVKPSPMCVMSVTMCDVCQFVSGGHAPVRFPTRPVCRPPCFGKTVLPFLVTDLICFSHFRLLPCVASPPPLSTAGLRRAGAAPRDWTEMLQHCMALCAASAFAMLHLHFFSVVSKAPHHRRVRCLCARAAHGICFCCACAQKQVM